MKAHAIWLCVCCVVGPGCGQRGDRPAGQSTNASQPAQKATNGGADNLQAAATPVSKAELADVTLKILSWKQTQKLIAGHKGKVVVLDMWSTTCLPCIREFPGLVKLHKKYGDRIACLSFSCDYAGIKSKPPETYQEKVLQFLKKQGATFENVLSNVDPDVLYNEIDLASIPAVFVYGPDGKLEKRFDNDEELYGEDGFSYEKHIAPLVEKLLGGE